MPTLDGSEPINSLASIVSDMTLPHEAKLSGVPDYYSWAFGPEIPMGNNPGNFTAITAYGAVYTDAAGNPAQNTRVQIRNLNTYILSKETGIWTLVQSSVDVEGAAFREDFAGNINVPADARQESDGSISVKLIPGYNYHFWPTGGRASINPEDVGGVLTTVEARLVIDHPALPDDRDQARLLMSVGGDYWLDTMAGWDNWQTNGSIAGGRFRYIDSEWDAFNMTTLTAEELYQNPPPMPFMDSSQASGPTTIRLEAEAADTLVGYRTEAIAAASDGQALSFVGGDGEEAGSATFVFTEPTGQYTIQVGTFDENDGVASFLVEVNGVQVGSPVVLDADLGSNVANAQTAVIDTVALGITLTSGDAITVKGFEHGGEHARLDFIELVPTTLF